MSVPDNTFPKILLATATVAIAAAIVGGLVLTGGPGMQRKQRMDNERSADLGNLARQVEAHYDARHSLPADWSALRAWYQDNAGPDGSLEDPRTGAPYEYERMSDSQFRLCATFETDTLQRNRNQFVSPSPWDLLNRHPAGRHCFRFEKQQDTRGEVTFKAVGRE